MPRPRRTLEQTFWDKTSKTDTCWLWTGWTHHGYGRIEMDGVRVAAHRFSWELHNGPIPAGEGYHGTCVLHKCDVRACVNPEHLFLGSAAENNFDRTNKGRQAHGEGVDSHKLVVKQVKEIRTLYKSGGYTQKELGMRYEVSQALISKIVRNELWTDVRDS